MSDLENFIYMLRGFCVTSMCTATDKNVRAEPLPTMPGDAAFVVWETSVGAEI